ncbi:hemicentin-1-like [Dendronephthya gigantea]|uniref:hemicentin-1-like n=1 Tax=Dendronephthya gigantea TaxID=151771 RepID=UPI00106ADFEF|nr:hemicentin-1-like [Dendronephthya gigantea]
MDGPSLRIVKENVKNFTISCRGKSYPTPHVVWKKNGTLIPSRENITTVAGDSVYQIITNSGWDEKTKAYLEVTSTLFLRTNGVKEEDRGIYTCEVLNVNESNQPLSKSVEIQFPPRITTHLSDTKMNESGNITLVCDAKGPPKPSFFWSIVRKNIKFGKKIINENVLELRDVTSTGNYYFTVICRASSKAGNVSTNATVEILVKPRIIHLNSSLTAELYSNIVLKCEILANPSARIWWTVNGINKTHLRNNVQISNDSKTLIITRAVLNNTGKYYCHARNSLSYTNKSLTLDFKVLPIAYIIDGNLVKLKQGQKNRNITCLGYGYPNTRATWKFNNTVIPEDPKLSKRNGMYQRRSTNNQALENVSSILYFNQAGSTFDDSGNYSCEVSIRKDSKTDVKIVRVIFYPIILTPPSNKTSLQDRNVRFDCEVDGRPFPQTSWLFKNQTVSTNHSTFLSNGSLLLYSVQNNAEYEGSYSCFAKNEAGSSEKSNAFLTVHVPTRILSISETKVHQLNDSVILTCNVSGDPRPNIAWSKANFTNPLRPPKFILSNDDQSLTIVNVTLREQGTYFCEARNKYATVKRNVAVNVEVRPEAIVNVSSVIYFTSIKEQVIVRCEGRGYPTPVVTWFRDERMVTTNRSVTPGVYQRIGNTEPSKFLGWISAILYVKPDASHAQFGNYTCNVTKLKDSQKDLKDVEIILVPSVSITKSPNTSTVLQGTNVTFNCTAIGVPKPTVTWRGRNTTLVPSVLGTSVLTLKNVTNKDEGMYECSAHNRGSPVKKKIKLIVHVRPQILQDLKDDDIENGTSYVLNCSAYGDPELTYSWFFNGEKSISNAAKNNTKSSLYINPVTIDNEGIYTCMVSNIEGNKTTKANITVFARPKISNSPVNQTHNETERAIFSCGGSGIPIPRVIWRKNNRSILNSSRNLVINDDGPYNTIKSWLKISNLSYADRGEYSCELRNRKDGDRTTSVLVVYVRPVATITVTPNTKRVKIEKPVLFTCTVYGFPRPQVSWMKNKEQLTRNNSRYSISFPQRNISNLISWFSYLEIKNLTRNDSANYSCFLRNDAGTDIDHVSLVVLVLPIAYIIDGNLVKLRHGQKNRSITCLGYGYPNTKATWKFNNTVIPEDPKLSIKYGMYQRRSTNNQALENVSSILYFNQAGSTFDDSGNYTCEVSIGKDSKTDSKIVRVIFYPIILTPPRNKTSLQDRNVRFDCEVDGRPFPQTSWLFKNQPVSTNRSTFLSNGSLLLYSVQNNAEYEGRYSCFAKNEAGSSEKSNAFLTVHVATRILSISETKVHQLDDSVILTCNVSGDPRPNIAWSKANFTNPLIPPKFILSNDDQSLTIVNVTLREQGTYFCEARNKYATVQRNVTVNVEVPAFLHVTPNSPNVFENNTIILFCNCGGCTLRPFWLKNSLPIYYNESGTPYSLLPNGSLVIKASRHTIGNYSCEIRTSNWVRLSRTVKLDVWYLNAFHVTGDENPYRGENISLSCQGDGNPYPSFTWYFNGQPLEQNSRILLEKNQLNVFNATMNDNGEYKCVANNYAGSVGHTVFVAIKDIPIVEISTYSPKYILVGTIVYLTCQGVTPIQSIHDIQMMELVKDGISFYKWPLMSRVRYTILFTARQNDTGKYQCKATIGAASRFSTPFSLIIGIPSGPVVLKGDPETSATGIRLSWHPISKTFWNGEEVSFKVNVFSVDHILEKTQITKTNSAIISGLRPKTAYIVNITGITVFGRFKKSAVTSVNTKENKNNMKYQLQIRLTDYKFSNTLLDETSSERKKLKYELKISLNDIFEKSAIRFDYISSSVSRFEKGSVIAAIVVSLSSQFKEDPSKLVSELNKADAIAGYKFDKSYTREEDFDECGNSGSNTCHEYAHCENVPGTYICNCFEGFFGDGEKCQGPPQIRSKSSNITQFVETNVTLVCTVFANPDPTISWKRADRDGKFTEVKKTRNKYDGNYSISNAGLEDSGTYLCYASNELGHDSYTTTVTIKPVIVDIDVEIKLSNKTFKEELKNKSSPAYKELEEDVYVELYNFFNNTPGFEDIEILGFVNGSVKVIFRVIVKVLKPSKESNDVVAVKIGRKINKQLKTGRIGNIQVVPDAIKLKVPPPPPANVTSSDVKETRVHIYWEPPELHEMFSIEKYYITYLKYGSKIWSNNTINAEQLTNTQLDNLESDTFYIIIIIAENAYGLGKESSRIEIKTKKVEVVSPWHYVGPIIGVAGVVLLVAIIFVVRRVLHSHAWKLLNGKSDRDKTDGKASFQMKESLNQSENIYMNVAFENTSITPAWKELPRTWIETSNKILTSGDFGYHVVQGTFVSPLEKERKPCSVKRVKENTKTDVLYDLLDELNIISAISSHENIVNLIGACTSENGPLLLVLEFCPRGTLKNNLSDSKRNEQLLMKKTGINLANEIAKGMTHLSKLGIVHHDLAAKNILLTEDFTPKITNFGLPHELYEQSSYHKIAQKNASIRWLAIESLTDGLYTTKSDVWSFAVVIWEIETSGCVPYPELEVEDLVSQIREGYRLSKPGKSSNETYKLMLQCWETNPDHRPTFLEIVDILEENLESNKLNKTFTDVPSKHW